ncbi:MULTISPECIES: MarR family transcriptional regulator [unclassified Brevibacterium]|uniref:MarR family winged helix-turn-helix transcriptional regulator n=1 Tax=unclassified Brevibacterium TaxID=2614124 RepID=UPI0010F5BE0D|nr:MULTISPECIES: MarR family transcriptional regulator [unclassified Brevibacterium]MCM1013590.1 MarR family transcriptional regulator [Brevibacterium sp. XM4083]
MSGTESDVELCGLVARLNQRLDSHIRRVADTLGITASQAIALRELGEPMRLTELAEHMSCETSNAGYVVDRMEDQGLVERRPHPSDRRAKLLSLTPAGQRCRANVLDALSDQAPVDALTTEERDSLVALLRRATA